MLSTQLKKIIPEKFFMNWRILPNRAGEPSAFSRPSLEMTGFSRAKYIQLGLALVCICSMVYIISSFWQNKRLEHRLVLEDKTLGSSERLSSLAPSPIPPLSYYEEKASRRNLFRTRPVTELGATSVVAAPDVLQGLSLKGIIFDQNPQAIVQDDKARKSYFVRIGDSFNGVIVKGIEQEKVVIEYQGQVLELHRK